MSFAEKLLRLRHNSGKSQTVVVNELKAMFPEMRISQTSYSALEHRFAFPRGDVLDKLATYYCVPMTYFVNDDNANSTFDEARKYLESVRTHDYTKDNWIKKSGEF